MKNLLLWCCDLLLLYIVLIEHAAPLRKIMLMCEFNVFSLSQVERICVLNEKNQHYMRMNLDKRQTEKNNIFLREDQS